MENINRPLDMGYVNIAYDENLHGSNLEREEQSRADSVCR